MASHIIHELIMRARLPIVAACLGLALAAPARADEPAAGWPIMVEAQVGAINTPLGMGLAVLYDRHGWFSAGAGLGVDFDPAAQSEGRMMRFGLFSRARLFQVGPFRLGVALNLSRGRYKQVRRFQSDYYVDSEMEWYWGAATRLDTGLGAELRGRRFALRIEGGPAFLLDSPTCHFETILQSYSGGCDSSEIPAPYHVSPEPGRISSYLMLSLSYRPGVDGNAAATNAGPMPTSRWAAGWTAKNWILSFLAADGAGVAGGLGLGGLAYLLVRDSFHATGDGAAPAQRAALGLMALAGSIGFSLGTATGAWLYGRTTERSDGSFAVAFLGGVLGMAVAAGVTAAVWKYTPQSSHDTAKGVATACVLVPILPALGATLGYAISSSAPKPRMALAQYEPGTGVSLGLPMILVSRSDSATTVNVPVVAGRF